MGQAQKQFTDEQLEVAIRLHDDFEYYAEHALKIKPKDKADGALVPLIFNTAQKYIYYRLMAQRELIGMIRAYILKGRQQGCSTFIEGFFFWLTSMNYGIKTFINTHSAEATSNLYNMAKRYLNNIEDPTIRPAVGISNKKELVFPDLDSGYRVSTAGSKETGRSDTIDHLHGSEVAFWENALTHVMGLLQAVPYAQGTSVIFESTANGMGGYFQKGYATAGKGLNGDYQAIFCAWYWQEEYRKPVPDGFALTEVEQEYVDLYDQFPVFHDSWEVTFESRKIDDEQMMWRRDKIAEFEGNVDKFNQEYPATPEMAFQYSATDSFIPPRAVVEALKRPLYRSYGAIVAAFDPAFTDNENSDRKASIYRQGANLFNLDYPKLDGHPAMVAYCKRLLEGSIKLDALFIDAGGGGYAIYDTLKDDGYTKKYNIILVNNAKKAEEEHKYANKRAEDRARLKSALLDEDMPLAIDIAPKWKDAFMTDMTAEGWSVDRNNRILIEKKEDVKKRLGISPEGCDVSALTYSRTIIRDHVMSGQHTQANNGRANVRKSLRRR
jgi:hypothetical protein